MPIEVVKIIINIDLFSTVFNIKATSISREILKKTSIITEISFFHIFLGRSERLK